MNASRNASRRLLWPALFAVALLAWEPAALASKHANGMPGNLPSKAKPADPEAIWIWFDNAGWHLRVSAGKAKHAFSGYVRASGGMTTVKPTAPGVIKRLELEGEGVRFELELAAAVHGFDWQQPGDACLTVELKIDGKQQPKRVFVGMRSESPDVFPFLACRG